MRIKDLPAPERPRERLLAYGPEALADRELLALLLGGGTPGADAVELAAKLIAECGGLQALSVADPHVLLSALPGVGLAKAARITAAFTLARRSTHPAPSARIRRTADIAACAAPLLRGERCERVVAVVCDTANRVMRTTLLTQGSTNRSLISVRDILTLVLKSGGVAFAVAHNHPSGSLEPSDLDRAVTICLQDAAEAVGLRFLDHVVITATAWARVTADR
jgi:DNA repair protein RadC